MGEHEKSKRELPPADKPTRAESKMLDEVRAAVSVKGLAAPLEKQEIAKKMSAILDEKNLPDEFKKRNDIDSKLGGSLGKANSNLKMVIGGRIKLKGYGPAAEEVFDKYVKFECDRSLELAKQLKERGFSITGFPGQEKEGQLHAVLSGFSAKQKLDASTLSQLAEMRRWNERQSAKLEPFNRSAGVSRSDLVGTTDALIKMSKTLDGEKYGGRMPEGWESSEKTPSGQKSADTLITESQKKHAQVASEYVSVAQRAKDYLKAMDMINRASIAGYEGNNLSLMIAGSPSFTARIAPERDFPGAISLDLNNNISRAQFNYPERIPEDGRTILADERKMQAIAAFADRIAKPVNQALREEEKSAHNIGWRCHRGYTNLEEPKKDREGRTYDTVYSWFDTSDLRVRTFASDGSVREEDRIAVSTREQNMTVGSLSYQNYGDAKPVGEPKLTGVKDKATVTIDNAGILDISGWPKPPTDISLSEKTLTVGLTLKTLLPALPDKSKPIEINLRDAAVGRPINELATDDVAEIRLSAKGTVQVRALQDANVTVRKPDEPDHELKREHQWIDLDMDDRLIVSGQELTIKDGLRFYKPEEQVAIQDSAGDGQMTAADMGNWAKETTAWQTAGVAANLALDASFIVGGLTKMAVLKGAEEMGALTLARKAFNSPEGRAALKELALGVTGIGGRAIQLAGNRIGELYSGKPKIGSEIKAFRGEAALPADIIMSHIGNSVPLLGPAWQRAFGGHGAAEQIKNPVGRAIATASGIAGTMGGAEMIGEIFTRKSTIEYPNQFNSQQIKHDKVGFVGAGEVVRESQEQKRNQKLIAGNAQEDENNIASSAAAQKIETSRSSVEDYNHLVKALELTSHHAVDQSSSHKKLIEGTRAALTLAKEDPARLKQQQELVDTFLSTSNESNETAYKPYQAILAAAGIAALVPKVGEPLPEVLGQQSTKMPEGIEAPLLKTADMAKFLQTQLLESDFLENRLAASNILYSLGQISAKDSANTFLAVLAHPAWREKQMAQGIQNDGWQTWKIPSLGQQKPFTLSEQRSSALIDGGQNSLARYYQHCCAQNKGDESKKIEGTLQSIMHDKQEHPGMRALAYSVLELKGAKPEESLQALQELEQAWQAHLAGRAESSYAFARQTMQGLAQGLKQETNDSNKEQLALDALAIHDIGGSAFLRTMPEVQQSVYSALSATLEGDTSKTDSGITGRAFAALTENLDYLKADQLAILRKQAVDTIKSASPATHELLASDTSARLENLFKNSSVQEKSEIINALRSFVKRDANALQELLKEQLVSNNAKNAQISGLEERAQLAINELSLLADDDNQSEIVADLAGLASAKTNNNTQLRASAVLALAAIDTSGDVNYQELLKQETDPQIRNELSSVINLQNEMHRNSTLEEKKDRAPTVTACLARLTSVAPTSRQEKKKIMDLAETMCRHGDLNQQEFTSAVMTALRNELRILPESANPQDFKASQDFQIRALRALSRHSEGIDQKDLPLLQAIAQNKLDSQIMVNEAARFEPSQWMSHYVPSGAILKQESMNVDKATGTITRVDIVEAPKNGKMRQDKTVSMNKTKDSEPNQIRLVTTIHPNGSVVYGVNNGGGDPAATKLIVALPGANDISNHQMPLVRSAAQNILTQLGQSVSETAKYASFNNRDFTAKVLKTAQQNLAGIDKDSDVEQVSWRQYQLALDINPEIAAEARKTLALLSIHSVKAAEVINEFCRNKGAGSAEFASILSVYLTNMPDMNPAIRSVHFQTLLAMADKLPGEANKGGSEQGFIPRAEVTRIAQQALDAQLQSMASHSNANDPTHARGMQFSAELMEYLHQARYAGNVSTVRAIHDFAPEGSQARLAAARLLDLASKNIQVKVRQLSSVKSDANKLKLPSLTIVNEPAKAAGG